VSNSDPITGQAAWFDLRVRLEKVTDQETAETEPRFPPQPPTPDSDPAPGLLAHHPTRPVRE
jgi:hypothetical protein